MGGHAQLTAALARRLAAESSLSYQDYEVLVALTDQPDGRLRVFELGETLGWGKSRVSHHLARMGERWLVRKVPCGTDRRGSFVAAIARGRREIESAPGHVSAVRKLFIDRRPRTAHQRHVAALTVGCFLDLRRRSRWVTPSSGANMEPEPTRRQQQGDSTPDRVGGSIGALTWR
jgi:DNA-binding MarR family transcriptional regulator